MKVKVSSPSKKGGRISERRYPVRVLRFTTISS
jgi:hypothetical protein